MLKGFSVLSPPIDLCCPKCGRKLEHTYNYSALFDSLRTDRFKETCLNRFCENFQKRLKEDTTGRDTDLETSMNAPTKQSS